MQSRYFTLLFMLFAVGLSGQNYLGEGNNQNLIVTSSDNLHLTNWYEVASGFKTISGAGLEGKLTETSRFLAQATLGSHISKIEEVAEMGISNWIDQQFSLPPTLYMQTLEDVYNEVYQIYIANEGNPNDFRCRPKWYHTNYAWWQMVMTAEDQLRQRVALALSEIIVVSKNSNLENYGWAIASFYDIFLRHAFGNYLDILKEVTLHPAMGDYLSHLNNPRSNPDKFTFPDENYARELMQLFSIGINELNLDGTEKLDQEGQPIPTYTNDDIDDLAKVFTGLGAGATSGCGESFSPAFGLDIRKLDMTIPMAMYEEWHEPGAKTIIGGYTIPSGQSGMQDIDDALNHVFDHPNVGPFLATRLIKHLIKSNPTPAYISRVASAFNDNGSGVRGDMQAVIKAILLDDEARTCSALQDVNHGKLRSPILRFTHFARAMDKFVNENRYWNTGDDFYWATGQHPMHAPSVFNFYQPDFQPAGEIGDLGLTGPEYQLVNSITGLEFFNIVNEWTFKERILEHRESGTDRSVLTDIYHLMGAAKDTEVLINQLDVLFTHGQFTDESRQLLKSVLEDLENDGLETIYERTILALYFFMISPDYLILK